MDTHSVAAAYSSKGELAYRRLRSDILSGVLAPGARLPQSELAASYAISITPLREAIRRLSGEGLLDVDTHRDVRVARVDAREARELLEVRAALEADAVERAALRRTADDLALLDEAASRLAPVTAEGGEAALIAHRDFHRLLYSASHNAVLVRLLDDVWDRADRYRRLGLALEVPDGSRDRDLEEHHRLLALVRAGEAAAAGELMRRHVERSLGASAADALEPASGT